MEHQFKVGDYATLLAGKYVWCVELQRNIAFEKDEVFKITHTTNSENDYFARLQLILFNLPGHIPSIDDNGRGEIHVLGKDLIPYTLPGPNF